MGNLKNLTRLDLDNNKLTGHFYQFFWDGQSRTTKHLSLIFAPTFTNAFCLRTRSCVIDLDIRCFSGNRKGRIQKDDAGLYVQKGGEPQLQLVHYVLPVASPYHDLGQVAEWPCVYVILALIKAGLAVLNPDVDPGGV